MRKPDTILDEVHAIRRRIDERTKGMTASERTAYFNQRGEAAAKNMGLSVLPAQRKNADQRRVRL